MASRIMHLAIANEIFKEIEIKDKNRFLFGSVLPDAYAQGFSKVHSHLVKKTDRTTTYRLSFFRELYKENIENDEMYMGYYIHLIQDLLFRHFVYDDYKWAPVPEGNIQKLHNDYGLLNSYIIDKYGISDNLIIPDDISKEAITNISEFDMKRLKENLKNDFFHDCSGQLFFFTEKMADDYIKKATGVCITEIKAMSKGKYIINETAYAWKRHNYPHSKM